MVMWVKFISKQEIWNFFRHNGIAGLNESKLKVDNRQNILFEQKYNGAVRESVIILKI